MTNIFHRVGIAVNISDVYQMLATEAGIQQWWTRYTESTNGAGNLGSVIHFKFPDGGPKFRVAELKENQKVVWEHVEDMPEQWQGTKVIFELIQEDDQVMVNFTHANWRQVGNFMGHCSLKWAIFLMSLKAALETGKGKPFPDDEHIDHF
ncbi:SRPBCC family protein [Thalassotalea sp. PS06]|uniref:SRPBCC family protein n=1 Tax=Thalassotalea sp. PS06 TaxID=2594005 RepID=UPI00116440CD|nr:SRPBCC domain-containing protein [Thalassotalea sp. PS06]QDP02752.1 SRPBCC domain-containing protein [Thalassotalea sp. PS06]